MVDAIFGIGLNTEVRGDALTAVHMMNTCDIPVVSADIPSGVEADTGRVLGGGGARGADGHLHASQGGPLCGQRRPVHRRADRGGHRHTPGLGGRGGLSGTDGGGGGCPSARPAPGRPQGGLWKGLSPGRQRGLYRRAGVRGSGSGALRRGPGDGGSAGPGVAHRGGQAG